ncbi:MAG: hypothetical protein E6K70_19165 [Planctomycetota bacterium]|nr:MAG: hypothetical protein E6K70_19165 [Planctomycetota bacterium]
MVPAGRDHRRAWHDRHVGKHWVMPHTVTDDPSKAAKPSDAALPSGTQAWDSGQLNGGQSFSHTFDTPGDYTYFCIPHESLGMVGRVTVTP